ncbi:TPA: MotA/TolQ/ExbB proton channel family protein [Methanosarcina acetivorans]|uniref:MotA/TolQ/ExbB proton channel family protein n=2 Tax=Methanosarcina acetivorans TaxID=2214 RepID=Q8THT6_METAC|nr:MotA/TolQ/ExbB proton channel family protein [Methanosarcina acetivorans C2A]HIH95435.1 MotA/TolQ/ExbB proton channel family protein [Methanosarcina acetivorans]
MSLEGPLFGIMYTFSAALLYPVVIVLMLSVLASLILIGEFLSEYAKRHRDIRKLEDDCKELGKTVKNLEFPEAAKALREIRQNFMVTSFSRDAAPFIEQRYFSAIEKLAAEYEIGMSKQLEKTKILATISPMLGLMGTLIPLGPALIGLSQGDIATLANNLMIAFATTVVGLFAGSVGYVLTQVRRRWYWEDLSDIDYILNVLEENFKVVSGNSTGNGNWQINEQVLFRVADEKMKDEMKAEMMEETNEKKQTLPADRAPGGPGRSEPVDGSC